jgi:hypothetical protein
MPATNAPAQLASGAGTALQSTVSTTAVLAQLATASGLAGIPGTTVTASTFPAQRLGLRVDLLLGGVWTDVTQYVYQRNPVQITGMGRADWTSTIQPAQLTLTLNDRDGRFTPKNSAGAYFPNITRNTQIRVFLSATSTAGQNYAGFRFWGEVSEWPPRWDPSGRDVSVDVVASGIWRRISQQLTTIGSAFRRYVDNLTGPAVQAYWPCEDGTGSGQLVPFGSPAGTANALQQFVGGQAGLSLASSESFHGSDAIPVLNGASIIATVPAGGTPTNNVTRFLLTVPPAGDSGSGTTNWNLVEIDSPSGTVRKFELYLNAAGTLQMQGVNSGGAVVFSGTTTTNVKGASYLVSMELVPSGGNINFALRIIQQGASGITESVTGTLTTATIAAVTRIQVSRAFALMDTAFGHLHVNYGAPTSMVAAATALNGYVGEKALDRFTRVCAEQGIATETIGTSSASASLGPQLDDTISNVLQSIEDTDCGLLYETKDQFGLGYRTNASMANQVVSVTFNYTAAVIDASLAPAYDDQMTRNNITITNWTGYTQQAILTAGAMSILNPPNGIGNGYGYTRSVNAAVDTQCPGIANFLLNVGAVDEVRFPVVSVKMIRSTSATLFSTLPNLDLGDYFQITNPPSFLTSTVIKQLVWGYNETLNAKEWTFAFNAVPETPWETGFNPGTIQTAQIPGGSPVSSQAQGSLGLAGLIANGSITPSMLNQGITIHTLGGNAVTISVNAPANPNLNDIWINSATGLISQWNGSAWNPITFNATNTIQAGTIISSLIAAGTIVASNIATGTLTASLIAAGQVYAGFVDATIIQAAEFLSVSTDTLPDYLAYTGSVGAGNLITSIAPVAGTDTVGNNYPVGIMGQQLTLVSQSGAPAALSGASQLYTSSQGRLRYLSSAGNDLIIDRCVVDLTNFTMNTQTIPHILSSTLNYVANEAIAGSEFELECDGTYTTPAGTSATFTLDLFLDGVAFSGTSSVTVGTVINQTGLTYAFCLRLRATVQTTGAGGTVNCALDGGVTRKGVNIGGIANQFATINNVAVNCAFDTTASHSIAMYCNWSSTVGTGHSAIVYRTRKTRRN